MTLYITSKIDNQEYCRKNGQFTKHLRKHGITYQEYYETYVTGRKEFCQYCNQPKTLIQANDTYRDTCGAKECMAKNLSAIKRSVSAEDQLVINEKRRQTNITNHGVEFTGQRSDVKAKILETNDKIVSDGKTSKELQQEKARETMAERYGDAFYNNAAQIKESKANQSKERKEEIQDKRIATTLEKYGVENVLLLPGIRESAMASNATLKSYSFPSGTEIKIQGYEKQAIDTLLVEYREDDLVVSDAGNISSCGAPIFEYINANRTHGKYYPDILIKSENKIIEVKSRWWYDGNGAEKYSGRLENNKRKRQAALDAGFTFEFWIYDSNGIREIIK
jgi:hypothetical protein